MRTLTSSETHFVVVAGASSWESSAASWGCAVCSVSGVRAGSSAFSVEVVLATSAMVAGSET